MGGEFLLDTNIVIALMNDDPRAVARFAGIVASVPLPVIGELEYGARNSSRAMENLERVEQFMRRVSINLPNLETAKWYGRVRHALRLKGRPLPENDMWIASLALQHDLTLVSRDAHFREIDGLAIDVW